LTVATSKASEGVCRRDEGITAAAPRQSPNAIDVKASRMPLTTLGIVRLIVRFGICSSPASLA
jgi:hypothetical protein